MRRLSTLLFLIPLSLLVAAPAVGGAPDTVPHFQIELEDVPKGKARIDLLNLFIRENANQTRIDVTLVNKRVKVGRTRSKLYYLKDLRVRPGQVIRIHPDGDLPPFEAKIQFIEAFFPTGKPPQLLIRAFGPPYEPGKTAKPYPRLSSDNFRGRRTLVEQKGERKPDLITCFGDTPGDLRIRFGRLADVKDVGVAFSTTYLIDDVQHRWDPNNGLQTRYQGTRQVKGRKRKP